MKDGVDRSETCCDVWFRDSVSGGGRGEDVEVFTRTDQDGQGQRDRFGQEVKMMDR